MGQFIEGIDRHQAMLLSECLEDYVGEFLIRRKALNAIQKAFSENGIELAAPRVIVEAQDYDQFTAAAAKAAIDARQQTPSAPADDR